MLKKTFFTLTLLLIGGFMQTKTVNFINEITIGNVEEILEKSNEKILVIDFYADWCQPCKQMAPVVDALSQELKDSYLFAKADFMQLQNFASKYNVVVLPTFLVIKNKEVIGKITGSMDQETLKKRINEALNPVDLTTLSQEELADKLSNALQEGNMTEIEKIIEAGINLNKPFKNGIFQGSYPLLIAFSLATKFGQLGFDMVKLLLESGASPELEISVPGSNEKTTIKQIANQLVKNWQSMYELSNKISTLFDDYCKKVKNEISEIESCNIDCKDEDPCCKGSACNL